MARRSNELRITNKTIQCGSEIYQINNLVRIAKYKKEKENGAFVFLAFIAALATFLLGSHEPKVIPVGIGLIVLFTVISIFRQSDYALRIETDSNSGDFSWTKKERQIDTLIDLIGEVMENDHRPAQYVVNLNDFSVRDVIMGDTFRSVQDAVAAIRGDGHYDGHVSEY